MDPNQKVFSAANCSRRDMSFSRSREGRKRIFQLKIVLVFSLCFFSFCLPRYFSHTPVALHTNFPDFTQALQSPILMQIYPPKSPNLIPFLFWNTKRKHPTPVRPCSCTRRDRSQMTLSPFPSQTPDLIPMMLPDQSAVWVFSMLLIITFIKRWELNDLTAAWTPEFVSTGSKNNSFWADFSPQERSWCLHDDSEAGGRWHTHTPHHHHCPPRQEHWSGFPLGCSTQTFFSKLHLG